MAHDLPFNATKWKLRSSIPNIPLNGTYSGLVQGPLSGVYDPQSRVLQSFSKQAHHFNGFSSTAQASVDNGKNWVETFNLGLSNTVVAHGWALPHPSIPSARLHFQMRWSWEKAFLIADGSITTPGGIDLYASENGTSYSFLQRIHSWPAINQVGGNGGAALWHIFPSVTAPIFLAGTGPDGEGAYWFASSYSFEAGGAGNRTTFKGITLHRSIDGGITWESVRDLEPDIGVSNVRQLFLSITGRIFLATDVGAPYFTDNDDLIAAAFTHGTAPGLGVRGNMVDMFGGTLLTHQNGSLIAGGSAWISCDGGANWSSTGVIVVPQNQTGFMAKLAQSEALIIAPGFSDPLTQTVAEYSPDGGETWQVSDPWLASTTGESPVMIGIQIGGNPITITRSGNCYICGDSARGVAPQRTICPLANAGLKPAAPVRLCGAPIAVNECD